MKKNFCPNILKTFFGCVFMLFLKTLPATTIF